MNAGEAKGKAAELSGEAKGMILIHPTSFLLLVDVDPTY